MSKYILLFSFIISLSLDLQAVEKPPANKHYKPSKKTGPTDISTVFIKLNVVKNVVKNKVRGSRPGKGGGLTSFGDELLLLTQDGTIFLVSEDEITKTNIEAPDNGLQNYIVASRSEKYRNYEHNFGSFRYNDILYYSEASRHGLVLSYTEWLSDEECYGTTISKLELPAGIKSVMDVQAEGDEWEIVYRTRPCLKLKSEKRAIEGHMAGGRIAYLKPHKIVLGSGDYHWDGVYAPQAYSQVPNNDYGKVLEIDLDDGTSRIISIGNRNMQGILVDSNGQIWVTEHGPRGGDELNRIVEGGNYGWPEETLGTRYSKLPWPGKGLYGRHDLHIAPTYAWVPSIAVSNLMQIEKFHPSWDGDLLAASLRKKSLFRLRIKDNRVVFAEPIKVKERIRYAHQHTNGRIVLWTDSKKLLFVSAAENTYTDEVLSKIIADSEYNMEEIKSIESAINRCGECHSFEMDDHEGSPGLGMIFESNIAATGYSDYSDALKSKSGIWTEDELSRFLQDPQIYAPGTSMPDPGIKDKFVIDAIVQILKQLSSPELDE